MNISVCIFGHLLSGYTQYPNETSTSTIFRNFYKNAKATTQIAIHRDDNLIYYGYIRKLEQNHYIGFCVILNSLMFTNFDDLFSIFENIVSVLARKGHLIKYNDYGCLVANTTQLYLNHEEIDLVLSSLIVGFSNMESTTEKLPPVNYAISTDSIMEFAINDDKSEILKSSYTNGYTYIYKSKGFNTALMNSYKGVLTKLSNENEKLNNDIQKQKEKISSLTIQLTKAKIQQRNIIGVGVLSLIVLILGIILWNKVLFPSEVTHYETGEFIYYGPIKDNKPHGIGVAIYPSNDKDGRKYYIGNFQNGERQDTAAILFYQDGDYYYGAMKGDKWDKGILYMNSDNSHFEGTFNNNNPYNGAWFDHKLLYKLINGEKSY